MASRTSKKAKGAEEAPPSPMEMWISRARAIGALLGFAIAFFVCRRQGFDVADAVLRGLIGAVALSLVTWWCALLVIQALMRSAADQTRREAEAAVQEAARARAQAAAAAAPPASGEAA